MGRRGKSVKSIGPPSSRTVADGEIFDFETLPVGATASGPGRAHYQGHRDRLRERLKRAGGEALSDYELLELYLFRTIHPQPIVLKPSAPSLPWEMLRTLFLSLAVFTVLYIGFVTARYGLGLLRQSRSAQDAE